MAIYHLEAKIVSRGAGRSAVAAAAYLSCSRIPNIPYLFVLWAFLKLGTAYRLAAGADFAHKLMGLGQTIGPAFADFAPGLAPFDWIVGIVGAVAFRVMVYVKSKNAKKFRRDEEYGSARWGCPKDIAPFVDPKFENNIILTGTEFLTMNTRPKNPANARNLNACVIGSSGSGKTRFWLTPQILQASADKNGGCSYVCVDPKGGVLGQVGHFLQKRGYRIKVFNSIDFTKSMKKTVLALAFVLFGSFMLSGCSKDEILDHYNNIVQSAGTIELTGKLSLEGTKEKGMLKNEIQQM